MVTEPIDRGGGSILSLVRKIYYAWTFDFSIRVVIALLKYLDQVLFRQILLCIDFDCSIRIVIVLLEYLDQVLFISSYMQAPLSWLSV